jgi:hypothetical protein
VKHAKNIFESIDKKRNGKITIVDLIKVQMPDIRDYQLDLISKWMNEPNKYTEEEYLQSQISCD